MLTIAFDLDGTLWPMSGSPPRKWFVMRTLYVALCRSNLWSVVIITAGNDVARVEAALQKHQLEMPDEIIVCREGVSKKILYHKVRPHLVIDDKESCCAQAIEAGAFALHVH